MSACTNNPVSTVVISIRAIASVIYREVVLGWEVPRTVIASSPGRVASKITLGCPTPFRSIKEKSACGNKASIYEY